jgi:hypothetical protein
MTIAPSLRGGGFVAPIQEDGDPLVCIWIEGQGYLAGLFALACRLEHVHPFNREQLELVALALTVRRIAFRVDPYEASMRLANEHAQRCERQSAFERVVEGFTMYQRYRWDLYSLLTAQVPWHSTDQAAAS